MVPAAPSSSILPNSSTAAGNGSGRTPISDLGSERFLSAPWLDESEPEIRRAVLHELAEERYPAGTAILTQGEPNNRLVFLVEGAVQVFWTYRDGREVLVTTLEAPACFGVPSFFRATPPTVTVRASTPVWLLTLDHPGHERLRRDCPRAAEALALAAVRVLADRFDTLDHRICESMEQHPDDHARPSEWASFRARLFERTNL